MNNTIVGIPLCFDDIADETGTFKELPSGIKRKFNFCLTRKEFNMVAAAIKGKAPCLFSFDDYEWWFCDKLSCLELLEFNTTHQR